jgi:hypothetical protein
MKTKFDKRKSKVNQTPGCYGNPVGLAKSIPSGYDASLKQKGNKNVTETNQQVPEEVEAAVRPDAV